MNGKKFLLVRSLLLGVLICVLILWNVLMNGTFVVLRRPYKCCPDDACWFVTVCRDSVTAEDMVRSFNNCPDLDFEAYFCVYVQFNYTLL